MGSAIVAIGPRKKIALLAHDNKRTAYTGPRTAS